MIKTSLPPGIVLVTLVGATWAAPPALRPEQAADAATRAAYKKLGFLCGSPKTYEGFPHSYLREVDGIGLPPVDLPVFAAPDFHNSTLDVLDLLLQGPLPKLPRVDVPFGLDFGGIGRKSRDEDLKQFSHLKQLCYLDLQQGSVTSLGLKDLAALENLAWLNLSATAITDDGLAELSRLRNLRYLDLRVNKVTDAGLRHVARLPHLQALRLSRRAISDQGVRHLPALKELAYLSLDQTTVTDAGLKELAGCKSLLVLSLAASFDISDDGVQLLADQFPKLVSLDVGYNPGVTDRAAKGIGKLENLRVLSLSQTQVTDDGLRDLARLRNLTALDLTGCSVTDAGLEHLAELKQLRRLLLRDPVVRGRKNLSERGVKKLQKALPQCHITDDELILDR